MDAHNHCFIIDRWENDPKQVLFRLHKESTREEVIESFQEFLAACGYLIPEGHLLDIIPNDQK